MGTFYEYARSVLFIFPLITTLTTNDKDVVERGKKEEGREGRN